jgi:hypothetical protein
VGPRSLFLSEQHAHSLRHAVVEDDGEVAYLYLTVPRLTEIAAAAWIYSRANVPVIPPSADGEELRRRRRWVARDRGFGFWTIMNSRPEA